MQALSLSNACLLLEKPDNERLQTLAKDNFSWSTIAGAKHLIRAASDFMRPLSERASAVNRIAGEIIPYLGALFNTQRYVKFAQASLGMVNWVNCLEIVNLPDWLLNNAYRQYMEGQRLKFASSLAFSITGICTTACYLKECGVASLSYLDKVSDSLGSLKCYGRYPFRCTTNILLSNVLMISLITGYALSFFQHAASASYHQANIQDLEKGLSCDDQRRKEHFVSLINSEKLKSKHAVIDMYTCGSQFTINLAYFAFGLANPSFVLFILSSYTVSMMAYRTYYKTAE